MTNSNQFYEGCGQEGPIRCIFLSEFHDTAGSKITSQVNSNEEIKLYHQIERLSTIA